MLETLERDTETHFRPYFRTGMADPVQYRVRCLPPEPSSWSLRQLSEEGSSLFRYRLGERLDSYRREARVFYAPTVHHMSGVVLKQQNYMKEIPLGLNFPQLLRPTDDAESDGIWIPPGSGFVMSAGGCPVIILTTRNGNCCVAHAGLDSLVDPYAVHSEGQPHPNASIIDTMVDQAKRTGTLPSAMTLRAFYAIPYQAFRRWFRDPKYAVRNQRLLAYLHEFRFGDAIVYVNSREHICLSTLIRLQAEKCGIGTIEVGHELPYNGDFAYTTHSVSSLAGACRNLVIVTRPLAE